MLVHQLNDMEKIKYMHGIWTVLKDEAMKAADWSVAICSILTFVAFSLPESLKSINALAITDIEYHSSIEIHYDGLV